MGVGRDVHVMHPDFAVLDARIVQLETDIATTGRMLTTGQTLGESISEVPVVPFNLSSDQVTGISIVFILAVLFPLAIAMARRLWAGGAEAMTLMGQRISSLGLSLRGSLVERLVTQLYTELAAEVRASGLLGRRYVYYWQRIGFALAAFVAIARRGRMSSAGVPGETSTRGYLSTLTTA